jgi:osmotically-inducible protein OsmY
MKRSINSLCLTLGIGVCLAATSVLTGCNNDQPSTTSQTAAGQYVDDKTLMARVHSALSDNPDYKFDGVDVNVSAGTVQLSGFVNTDDQKTKAAEIAKGVAGVKDVENKITLKPAQ